MRKALTYLSSSPPPSASASWELRDWFRIAVADDAEKAYQLALNKQLSAQRNVAVSRAEVARAKAQVAQMQAALDNAEEDLRNSTIVSPMDGLVLSRDVEVGDAVSSILILGSQATSIMTLGDVSEVYVKGKVDEADISKVYLSQHGAHFGRVAQRQEVYGQGNEDLPPGRREGQRHYL